MKIRNILMLCLTFSPSLAFSGQGWIIQVNNQLEPTKRSSNSLDVQYPLVTAHAINGSTCWYDYDLGTWDKYSMANAFGPDIYTEQEDSFFTSCSQSTTPVLRDMALFIKTGENSGWERLSAPMQLTRWVDDQQQCSFSADGQGGCSGPVYYYSIVNELNDSGAIKRELARINNGHGGAGFTLNSSCGVDFSQALLSWTADRPRISINVSGKFIEGCTSVSKSAVRVTKTQTSAAVSSKRVVMRLGKTQLIKLPSLDGGSSWELDQCTGNAVSTGGVIPREKKVKLPNEVAVKATNKGVEECTLTAWSYSTESGSRTFLTTLKYVFNVR